MNLVETIKKIFTEREFMNEFNGMHVDYSNNNEEDSGLFLTNDRKISEDIVGNVKRQASFTVYRNVYSLSDAERIQNSAFILELSAYLESLSDEKITFEYKIGKEKEKTAYIDTISCSNGMVFQYLGNNPGNGAQYMLQLNVIYVVKF